MTVTMGKVHAALRAADLPYRKVAEETAIAGNFAKFAGYCRAVERLDVGDAGFRYPDTTYADMFAADSLQKQQTRKSGSTMTCTSRSGGPPRDASAFPSKAVAVLIIRFHP